MYINLSGKCKLAFVVCLLKITQINATLAFGSNKSFQFFSVYLIPVKLLQLDKMSSTEINMYLECALEYNVGYIIYVSVQFFHYLFQFLITYMQMPPISLTSCGKGMSANCHCVRVSCCFSRIHVLYSYWLLDNSHCLSQV